MTDFLSALHRISATALLVFALVLAVWGTYLYFRKAALSGGFRSSFLIMFGLTVVQGLLGAVLLLLGNRPGDWPLHIVYGIFAVLALPAVYRYAQGGTKSREAVFLAGAAWVVAIAYFRGIATG
jgi:heme A synthase